MYQSGQTFHNSKTSTRLINRYRQQRLNTGLLSALTIIASLTGLSACSSAGTGDRTVSENSAAPATASAQGSTQESTPITPPPITGPVSCTAEDADMQSRLLSLINAARAEERFCGDRLYAATTALSWNDRLMQAAHNHSRDMATHNFFSHTGSDGSSVSTRVDATGYAWRAVGENIAAGQSFAEEAVDGWLNSPGHCRNLMSPNYTDVAVDCVENSGSDYNRYWTNVLADDVE